jgi:hypothetical protein
MSDDQNLLDSYDLLFQQSADRIEPLLAQLRQRVDDELDRIRQQEAELLEAQTQALLKLQTAIGVDARFLLKTSKFKEFFDKFLQPQPKSYRHKIPARETNFSNWSIARSDKPVRVFNYQETFDLDDYDDERNYASYGFEVKVGWGEEIAEVDYIRTLKIYGVEDYRHTSFPHIVEEIAWRLEDFPSGEEGDIQDELSCLVTYCCLLLAQQPPTVKFTYNSAEQEKRDLWQLPI